MTNIPPLKCLTIHYGSYFTFLVFKNIILVPSFSLFLYAILSALLPIRFLCLFLFLLFLYNKLFLTRIDLKHPMLISIFICSYVYLSICLYTYLSCLDVCSSFCFCLFYSLSDNTARNSCDSSPLWYRCQIFWGETSNICRRF